MRPGNCKHKAFQTPQRVSEDRIRTVSLSPLRELNLQRDHLVPKRRRETGQNCKEEGGGNKRDGIMCPSCETVPPTDPYPICLVIKLKGNLLLQEPGGVGGPNAPFEEPPLPSKDNGTLPRPTTSTKKWWEGRRCRGRLCG